jgi:hypothetical protein
MKLAPALLLPVLLFAAGCSGGRAATKPEDTTLQEARHAGREAFTLERPKEAAAQYKHALARARERDDATAIGDAGYDLAVAQLAANEPKQAVESARLTRTELERRGAASFPALDLVEAAALYRLGAKREADALAVRAEASNEQAAAARASFLRGLIADETGDVANLDRALARLAHPASPEQAADADELAARRDLRRGQLVQAIAAAERAADARRSTMDYRGMARALSVAAAAAARAGDRQTAADLYMRAGQSAAAQGDVTTARPWLHQALALGSDPALRRAARQSLASLAGR